MEINISLAIFLFFVAFTLSEVNTRTSGNFLDLIHLDDHPLAVCNDGTTAVYYRKPLNSDQETKKILIYMRGGGFCVPHVPGKYLFIQSAKTSSDYLFQVITVLKDVKIQQIVPSPCALLQQSLSWILTNITVTPSSAQTL